MKQFESQQQDLLYLVEFGPAFEQVLQQQVVLDRLEVILYEWAQTAGLEIDSCDVLPDYIAITFYVKPLVDIDHAIVALKKYSSDALLKEFTEFKQCVVDGSLWDSGYDVELL